MPTSGRQPPVHRRRTGFLARSLRGSPTALLIALVMPATAPAAISEFPVRTPASTPFQITAGPDRALWFTEGNGNKIGRITTTGEVEEFRVPTPASSPQGIAAGPDGALWFTELVANKIGRITTSGRFKEFTIPTPGSDPRRIAPVRTGRSGSRRPTGTDRPYHDIRQGHRVHHPHPQQQSGGDHRRPGRGAVVRRERREQHRADHDGRRLPRVPRSHLLARTAPRTGSRPARTARSGSRSAATTRSAASPRPERSASSTSDPRRLPGGDRCRPGRRAVVHRAVRQPDRPDHHRGGHQRASDPHPRELPDGNRVRARPCHLVHGAQREQDRPRDHRGPDIEGAVQETAAGAGLGSRTRGSAWPGSSTSPGSGNPTPLTHAFSPVRKLRSDWVRKS